MRNRVRDLRVWNYDDAREQLNGQGGRVVCLNTRLEENDDGTVSVILHATRIVTYHPDGRVTLNSGGWQTHTTKDRINRCLPPGMSVYQESYRWKVRIEGKADGPTTVADFYDNMTIGGNGR